MAREKGDFADFTDDDLEAADRARDRLAAAARGPTGPAATPTTAAAAGGRPAPSTEAKPR